MGYTISGVACVFMYGSLWYWWAGCVVIISISNRVGPKKRKLQQIYTTAINGMKNHTLSSRFLPFSALFLIISVFEVGRCSGNLPEIMQSKNMTFGCYWRVLIRSQIGRSSTFADVSVFLLLWLTPLHDTIAEWNSTDSWVPRPKAQCICESSMQEAPCRYRTRPPYIPERWICERSRSRLKTFIHNLLAPIC